MPPTSAVATAFAEAFNRRDQETMVLLRRRDGRALDVAMRLQERDGRIARIDYLVTAFRRDEMVDLASPLGIEVCSTEG